VIVETARRLTIEHRDGTVEEYLEGEFAIRDISTDHRGVPTDPVRFYMITVNVPLKERVGT
jgi:hypothetical protein